MSDEESPDDKPTMRAAVPPDDPEAATNKKFKLIGVGLVVVAILAVVAIVLPFVIDNDDCNSCDPNTRSIPDDDGPLIDSTPAPTSPRAPTPTAAPVPGATMAPTTARLRLFIENFLIDQSGVQPFASTDSAHYKAAEFLANEDNVAPTLPSEQHLGDRYALVLFYQAMAGDGWLSCFQGDENCGQPWKDPDVNHCDWEYVGCNDDGRVNELVFRTYHTDKSV